MNRGGFLRDLLFIPAFLGVMILGLFFFSYIYTSITDIISGIGSGDATVDDQINNVIDGTKSAFGFFDVMIIVVTILLMIGVWVLVSMIPSKPIFFWLSLIPVVLSIVLATIPSNIILSVLDNEVFATLLTQYTSAVWVAQNLPHIVFITAVVSSMILYRNAEQNPFSSGGGYY